MKKLKPVIIIAFALISGGVYGQRQGKLTLGSAPNHHPISLTLDPNEMIINNYFEGFDIKMGTYNSSSSTYSTPKVVVSFNEGRVGIGYTKEQLLLQETANLFLKDTPILEVNGNVRSNGTIYGNVMLSDTIHLRPTYDIDGTKKNEAVKLYKAKNGNTVFSVPKNGNFAGGDIFSITNDGRVGVGLHGHTFTGHTLGVYGNFGVGFYNRYLDIGHNYVSNVNVIHSVGEDNGLAFSFWHTSGNAYAETMRLRPNGKVGIGIPDPAQNLQVKDTIAAEGLLIGTTVGVPGTVMTIDGAVHISKDDGTNIDPKKSLFADYSLWVQDGIVTDDVAIVDPDLWSDYVFEDDYELMTLDSLSAYIKAHRHLPNVPSEEEVMESGYTLNMINAKLLEKIEELTLHTIRQEEEIKRLEARQEKIEALYREAQTR